MDPIRFDNSYARLPPRFYTRQIATPVPAPALIALNTGLAAGLGLDPDWLASDAGISALAGNAVPPGAAPLAQAYAGHQFGGFSPQLGDGRALLLGEVIAPDGRRFDLQLKGSGPTPYSRMGDGRAWIGPVMREYIMSEAMAALGIPTTRALAALTTGETIYREGPLPGAILTRVAASHIRVGTFEYFAARQDNDAIAQLIDHVIARHFPDTSGALGMFDAVVTAQARLIAAWMGVGFVHGVMNTDNMALSGETIDYGPCAFIDGFAFGRVFSSIDQHGRYAYANQPRIAIWNLAQLGSALIPAIPGPQDTAIDSATEILNRFTPRFTAERDRNFRAKLGLTGEDDGDIALIDRLLALMDQDGADFTDTFRALADGDAADQFTDREAYHLWHQDWQNRLAHEDAAKATALMRATNPAIIPRTHRIEAAIEAALAGDMNPFHRLNRVLATPFAPDPADLDLARAPLAQEIVPATFCGT